MLTWNKRSLGSLSDLEKPDMGSVVMLLESSGTRIQKSSRSSVDKDYYLYFQMILMHLMFLMCSDSISSTLWWGFKTAIIGNLRLLRFTLNGS